MTVSLKHKFTSAKSDGGDATLVRPSNWNDEHDLTMATARLLGRTTAGTGSAEEISVGTGLTLSAGSLSVTTNTYQPLDADLTALAGLASAADRLPYFTGSSTASLATFTSFARTLLDDTDAATARATLGAAASTDIVGPQTIWIPAGAMTGYDGQGPTNSETQSGSSLTRTLNFDGTAAEYAHFTIRMPKSWNIGTLTAQFVWSQLTTAAGTVNWGIAAMALSDGNTLNTAGFSTTVTVTDTGGTANTLYISDVTSAFTIGNTPAAQDYVDFFVARDPAADTLVQDARLHGVTLIYTTSAATDV